MLLLLTTTQSLTVVTPTSQNNVSKMRLHISSCRVICPMQNTSIFIMVCKSSHNRKFIILQQMNV